MRKYSIVLLLLFAAQALLTAQSKVLVSGSVVDATSNEPLSFATVSLKKQLIGIVTNESGRFDLFIPEDLMGDTLLISFFGYRPQLLSLKNIHSPVSIRLLQVAVDLKEIVIKPQPPEFYIRLAMVRIKENYPNKPFQSEAYYREKVLENKNFIKCDEGIFKTYCPNYQDTVKNQNQLLLFRQEKNIHEVEFMLKERKEAAEKEKKRAEKENAKNKKKGINKEVKAKESGNMGLDLASSFGGPNDILRQGDIAKNTPNFLDTGEFKNYRYSYAKSSSYNNHELMVIDFKSRGKVEHMREEGRIYIDMVNYAIVKVESAGNFVIPVILRPVLFLYGFGIENPRFQTVIEFQQVQQRWYPKNIQYNINLNISNKHWFRPNEHSDFVIEGVYTVNKMKISDVSPIPVEKRFKAQKDMNSQVHNDEGITWSEINIIKK